MRIKKLQKLITEPLLVSNQENLQYLTGRFFIDDSFLLVTKKQAILFGGILEQVSGIKTDHLRNIGKYLRSAKVLEVEGSLRIAESDFIKKSARGVKLKVVPSPVRGMRLFKDSAELREMQKAYEITAKVFAQIKKALLEKPWTEIELARFIKLAGLKLGADDVSFQAIVASGKNSAIPHHKPTTKEIKKGEPVVLDFGFKVNGYCSDFTRTVFIKSVSPKMRAMYEATYEAYQKAVDVTKSGALARDVDEASRKVLKKT
jgi:Xaa-Pro aminopeptidase